MTTSSTLGGPTFEKTTLDNGARVVTSSMPHTRSVTACVFVGVGSRYETEDNSGISHVIEHLVFKGTGRRPDPRDISGTVESVGGDINAATEQELTAYWCKVPQHHLEESLDLLIDMLRGSLYRPEDIEKERTVIFEEQRMVHDNPGHKVEALIDGLLWPDHPLGREISGTRESVANADREAVLGHLDRFYNPSNIVVSVAGNLEHDRVVHQLDALCEGWQPRPLQRWQPFDDSQAAPRLGLHYRGTQQAHLSLGLPGLPMTHPRRYALDLLSVILGEGMSSRLFLEIREKRGLAYDIHSGVSYFRDCGALMINAGVDPTQVYTAAEAIILEVGRLREGVPDDEAESAKRLVAGRLLLRMEDSMAVAAWMGGQELLVGRIADVDQVVDHVNRVTPQDIADVANDLFTTERLNMAVVGPFRGRSRFEKVLNRALPVPTKSPGADRV